MTKYRMVVEFNFESDLTDKEIQTIKKEKGDVLTSDKITLTDFSELQIVEVIKKTTGKIAEQTCSCQWELSSGPRDIWDSIEVPYTNEDIYQINEREDDYEEYVMDDKTKAELNAWVDFSMGEDTKDKPIEELWEEFKASYKA